MFIMGQGTSQFVSGNLSSIWNDGI